MAVLAAIALAALLFENDDLLVAKLLDDFAGHQRAINERSAQGDVGIGANHENVFEGDGIAGFTSELFDADQIIGSNFVLLATGLDDCKHMF